MFSVVFIVRNEEKSLPDAVKSLGDVPEVIVCDTGSEDGTIAVARSLGATVCEFAWQDDFSAARAFAASQARYEWIVRFDADERLTIHSNNGADTWLARAVTDGIDSGAAMVCVRREHSPGFVHWFPRCYRRNVWAWRHPVHEVLLSRTGQRLPVVAADGAIVTHRPNLRKRPYRAMLERAVERSPADPHLSYFLARTYFDERDYEACLRCCDMYLATLGGYWWHRSEAHLLRARCYRLRGDITAALDAYEIAARVCGPRAEPLLEAAQLAIEQGLWDRAWACIADGRGMSIPQELQMFGTLDVPYVIDPRAYTAAAWAGIISLLPARRSAET